MASAACLERESRDAGAGGRARGPGALTQSCWRRCRCAAWLVDGEMTCRHDPCSCTSLLSAAVPCRGRHGREPPASDDHVRQPSAPWPPAHHHARSHDTHQASQRRAPVRLCSPLLLLLHRSTPQPCGSSPVVARRYRRPLPEEKTTPISRTTTTACLTPPYAQGPLHGACHTACDARDTHPPPSRRAASYPCQCSRSHGPWVMLFLKPCLHISRDPASSWLLERHCIRL